MSDREAFLETGVAGCDDATDPRLNGHSTENQQHRDTLRLLAEVVEAK